MDGIKQIQGKLSRAYDSIQMLKMPQTNYNMEIVMAVKAAMKDAYDFLDTINAPEEDELEMQVDKITDGEKGVE